MKINNYNTMAREFANFANVVDRMLSPYDYARNGGSANGANDKPTKRTGSLPMDIWADESAFTIVAYVPGVKPEEVEITMEGEELRIRGHFPKLPDNVQSFQRELFRGGFERRLTISVPVNAEAIRAEYENGLLTLTIPKAEEVKPKQIKVLAR
jgi:HSP20 family protein